MKKGYWIAMVAITDKAGYGDYVAANKPAFDKYGAKFLARGGSSESPDGFGADRCVIIEFDSYQTALDCYHSPEYQTALKLRRAYATAHFAIVEGV